MSDYKLQYNAVKTAQQFHASPAFVRTIMGPIGSGKSVACCMELFAQAKLQAPDAQGVRRSRSLVIRNTLPQLESTTIKTWLSWFPEKIFGKYRAKPPYTHHINLKLGDGTWMDYEVIFLALDRDDDAGKLLSLEATNAWVNEAKEVDKTIIDHLTGRLGRYPSVKDRPENHVGRWPTRHGLIMDTNFPEDDSWIHDYAENDGWLRDETTGLIKPKDMVAPEKRWDFFKQPGGLTPEAENIENLPPDYYDTLMTGKKKSWIDVYVHAKYGQVEEGEAVYKGYFNKENHLAKDVLKAFKELPIYLGIDCSGRNPAAVAAQRLPNSNQIRIVWEFCMEGIGAELFADFLAKELTKEFPDFDFEHFGDPAGFLKAQNDERTYADILKSKGLKVKPSPVMRRKPRIEAVRSLLMRNTVGGIPAVQFSKRCRLLVTGFEGGYRFKKIQGTNPPRYNDEPEKNKYSHPHDALQYVICGMGEYNQMLGRNNKNDSGQKQSAAVNLNSPKWKVT